MNTLETLDRLRAVVHEQADIIWQQALFIEEQLTVDEAVKNQFAARREAVDGEIALVEGGLTPLSSTGLRKGD